MEIGGPSQGIIPDPYPDPINPFPMDSAEVAPEMSLPLSPAESVNSSTDQGNNP